MVERAEREREREREYRKASTNQRLVDTQAQQLRSCTDVMASGVPVLNGSGGTCRGPFLTKQSNVEQRPNESLRNP